MFLVRRLRSGPEWDASVILVIEAESEDAVHETLARDPWSETHLRTDTVEPWTIRLDGRRRRA